MITITLLFFASAILLFAGLRSMLNRRRFLNYGVHTQGVITEVKAKGEESFEAEIAFETQNRQVVFVNQYLMGNRWCYRVGQSVSIIYDPVNATKFIWEEGPNKPGGSGAIYAGAVCLMIAISALMAVLR